VEQDDRFQSLLRVCIVLLCVGAAVLIFAIASSAKIDAVSSRATASAVALAFVTLVAAAGARLVERQPGMAMLGYLAIGAALLSLAVSAVLIWGDSLGSGSGTAHWAWYTLIAAFALANTCALLFSYDDLDPDAVKLVRLGTVLALWALVITVLAEIHAPGRDVDPRQFGVTAVVYGLGVILLPLLRRTG
jgi:hypothetical protein